VLWYLFSYDGPLLWETLTGNTDRNEIVYADFDNRRSSEENVTCICWCIIIIIIIIIIILVINFMQSIYNYILETNHFSRVYTDSVAAVLYL
jgi:hypothetical protein